MPGSSLDVQKDVSTKMKQLLRSYWASVTRDPFEAYRWLTGSRAEAPSVGPRYARPLIRPGTWSGLTYGMLMGHHRALLQICIS